MVEGTTSSEVISLGIAGWADAPGPSESTAIPASIQPPGIDDSDGVGVSTPDGGSTGALGGARGVTTLAPLWAYQPAGGDTLIVNLTSSGGQTSAVVGGEPINLGPDPSSGGELIAGESIDLGFASIDDDDVDAGGPIDLGTSPADGDDIDAGGPIDLGISVPSFERVFNPAVINLFSEEPEDEDDVEAGGPITLRSHETAATSVDAPATDVTLQSFADGSPPPIEESIDLDLYTFTQ